MAMKGKLLQPLLVPGVLILLSSVASAASKPSSSCHRKCGGVEIPYPFGTSVNCSLDSTFLITCNNTSHPPKPSLGPDMFVENISVLYDELRVSNPVASLCKNVDHRYSTAIKQSKPNNCVTCKARNPNEPVFSTNDSVYYDGDSALFKQPNFRISDKRNKITAVGCGVYSFIRGSVEQKGFTTGCLSLCNNDASDVVNGSCSGIGCCQTSIPKGATEFNLTVRRLSDSTETIRIGECAYGFIVDEKAYDFLISDFEDLRRRETVPLVLDWAVGNKTCKEAEKNEESYACKAPHSYCYNSRNSPGYRCSCSDGYQGNPYLPNGTGGTCQDIDECKLRKAACVGNATCNNTDGNYTCTCRHGFEGDGRLPPGIGCRPKVSPSRIIPIALGISICLLVLLVGSSLVYWVLQKRKLIKLKKKWFQQNGGLMLQQRLANHTASMDTAKIFSIE